MVKKMEKKNAPRGEGASVDNRSVKLADQPRILPLPSLFVSRYARPYHRLEYEV